MNSLIKKTGAWVPIALSLAMLAFILVYLAMFGVSAQGPDADERAPARLFQLWLFLEALMIPFFVVKWLPQNPKQALFVLTLQIVAVLSACFPVFYLEL